MLAEAFRANDKSASIGRAEGSPVTRIEGTFDLRRVADALLDAARETNRQKAEEWRALPPGEGIARLRRLIGPPRQIHPSFLRAVEQRPTPTRQPSEVRLDMEGLLIEALRANDRFAQITREPGSSMARIEGTFVLRRIADVFWSAVRDLGWGDLKQIAPKNPDEITERVRIYLAPHK